MEEQARLPGAGRPVAALRAGATPSPTLSRSSSLASSLGSEEPMCRYCWGPGTPGDPLVAPCNCRGTSTQVHHTCLARWMSSSIQWASGNTLGMLRPASCELCNQPFFEASPARRNHLLTTARLEWQLKQLHTTAGQLAEAEAAPALPQWGRSALSLAGVAQASYWRLALRPVQVMLLYQEIWYFVKCQLGSGAREVSLECIMQVWGWWAGRFASRTVPSLERMAAQGASRAALCQLAFISLSIAIVNGKSIEVWLADRSFGGSLFQLRAPITASVAWVTSALATLGVLLPGRIPFADGLRAAAGLPLRAAKWVLSAEGRAQIRNLLRKATFWVHSLLVMGSTKAA